MKRNWKTLILAQALCCLLAAGAASAQDGPPESPSLGLVIGVVKCSRVPLTPVLRRGA